MAYKLQKNRNHLEKQRRLSLCETSHECTAKIKHLKYTKDVTTLRFKVLTMNHNVPSSSLACMGPLLHDISHLSRLSFPVISPLSILNKSFNVHPKNTHPYTKPPQNKQ